MITIRVKLYLALISALLLLVGVGFISEDQLHQSVENADRVSLRMRSLPSCRGCQRHCSVRKSMSWPF